MDIFTRNYWCCLVQHPEWSTEITGAVWYSIQNDLLYYIKKYLM